MRFLASVIMLGCLVTPIVAYGPDLVPGWGPITPLAAQEAGLRLYPCGATEPESRIPRDADDAERHAALVESPRQHYSVCRTCRPGFMK